MMEQYRSMIETALEQYSEDRALAPLLVKSMRYGLLNGGKRIRPCLLLCVCEMLGGKLEIALSYACALEMIHSYSLIHDDLPAMDNDDYRRGKPSNHKKFGEGNAILAGDGLLTAAALLLTKQNGHDEAKQIILRAALDMVSGQSYDLNAIARNEDTLHILHAQKTGALFRAAVAAGAVLADENMDIDRFAELGEKIGLLFQMTDDLLDAEKDSAEDKFTYLTFYGSEKTKRYIHRIEQEILSILEPYHNEPAHELKAVVRHMTNRTE